MTMSTDADILEYFPDLKSFGIQDFTADHAKTRGDILRQLRIDWWPRMTAGSSPTVTYLTEMDDSLLNESQFTRAAVFHVLSYYILPKLAKFDPEGDKFGQMMQYYKGRFDEEFANVLKDGVEYDFDDDGTVEVAEKQTVFQDRLVR